MGSILGSILGATFGVSKLALFSFLFLTWTTVSLPVFLYLFIGNYLEAFITCSKNFLKFLEYLIFYNECVVFFYVVQEVKFIMEHNTNQNSNYLVNITDEQAHPIRRNKSSWCGDEVHWIRCISPHLYFRYKLSSSCCKIKTGK